jgi:hypothetical protein
MRVGMKILIGLFVCLFVMDYMGLCCVIRPKTHDSCSVTPKRMKQQGKGGAKNLNQVSISNALEINTQLHGIVPSTLDIIEGTKGVEVGWVGKQKKNV